MGKILIIKGADFYSVAVDNVPVPPTPTAWVDVSSRIQYANSKTQFRDQKSLDVYAVAQYAESLTNSHFALIDIRDFAGGKIKITHSSKKKASETSTKDCYWRAFASSFNITFEQINALGGVNSQIDNAVTVVQLVDGTSTSGQITEELDIPADAKFFVDSNDDEHIIALCKK